MKLRLILPQTQSPRNCLPALSTNARLRIINMTGLLEIFERRSRKHHVGTESTACGGRLTIRSSSSLCSPRSIIPFRLPRPISKVDHANSWPACRSPPRRHRMSAALDACLGSWKPVLPPRAVTCSSWFGLSSSPGVTDWGSRGPSDRRESENPGKIHPLQIRPPSSYTLALPGRPRNTFSASYRGFWPEPMAASSPYMLLNMTSSGFRERSRPLTHPPTGQAAGVVPGRFPHPPSLRLRDREQI